MNQTQQANYSFPTVESCHLTSKSSHFAELVDQIHESRSLNVTAWHPAAISHCDRCFPTANFYAGAAVCHLCGSSAGKLTELRESPGEPDTFEESLEKRNNTMWISRRICVSYILPVDSAAYALFNILYSYNSYLYYNYNIRILYMIIFIKLFIYVYIYILRICFCFSLPGIFAILSGKIASFTVTSLARPLPRQRNIEQVGSGWRKLINWNWSNGWSHSLSNHESGHGWFQYVFVLKVSFRFVAFPMLFQLLSDSGSC